MCHIMDNHKEILEITQRNQDQLIEEIRKIAQNTHDMQAFAESTVNDAKNIIDPRLLKMINWYHAFLLLASCIGAISTFSIWLWLNANYVTISKYDAAWDKQMSFNVLTGEQFKSLETSNRINEYVDKDQTRRIEKLEQINEEIKKMLKK